MERTASSPIFSPCTWHGITLKNRLLVAPMSRVSALANGAPGHAMQAYYAGFAKGGFAGIITEGVYTDRLAAPAYAHQPGITNSEQEEGWRRVVHEVKKEGAVIICQLMHGGALSQCLDSTLAPSAVRPAGKKMRAYGGEGMFAVPAEMQREDIAHVVRGFARAARHAHAAGFHGVELHAANGYLLDQFLTDYTNLRTDQYGGSIENQFRIVAEIIAAIGEAVPGMPVGVRLSEGKVNNLMFRWKEGASRAVRLLQEVAKAAPAYVHIASERGSWADDVTYDNGTSFTGLARRIVQVPVIANGGLHNVPLAEKVLNEGHGDMIALGRAALADPGWPDKVRQGKEPRAFHPGMIREKATIQHTETWIAAATQ